VTACSRYLLEKAVELEPAVGAKGCAIHNGIDAQRFAIARRAEPERRYILFIGRLTAKKGVDLLIEAFARVAAQLGVDLVIAGEGEEGPSLREQTRRLAMGERIRFLGRASSSEVVDLIRGARFVVVPSKEEPFGIVALEALAAGTPVLATAVGGLPELIASAFANGDRPNGSDLQAERDASILLVEPNVDSIATGLRQWMGPKSPPPLTETRRRHVLARFDWSRVVDRYEAVLCDPSISALP
jgi:glycosyltransferase involved in cell wall biosynthesis